MYGPHMAILLMHGSHDMRHTGFRKLTVVNEASGFWGITSLVQAHCTCLGACGCIDDTYMGSLCLRLFMMVHGCWQSISSCGMISTRLLGVVCHSY